MTLRHLILPFLLVTGTATVVQAQGGQLPFTAAENKDGARFVWFIVGRAGFTYDYIPADSFPTSGEFTEVDPDSARAGDIAYWPKFVAVFSGPPDNVLVVVGPRIPLKDMVTQRGKARFYRKLVPVGKAP